jgi:hypothetical protein
MKRIIEQGYEKAQIIPAKKKRRKVTPKMKITPKKEKVEIQRDTECK